MLKVISEPDTVPLVGTSVLVLFLFVWLLLFFSQMSRAKDDRIIADSYPHLALSVTLLFSACAKTLSLFSEC